MEMIAEERLESLKAGLIGGLSAGLAFLITTVVNGLLLNQYFSTLNINQFQLINLQFLLSAGIAGFSGFLFGVTYRYIIRVDKNPQLKSYAALAFGLVRGLNQIEFGWNVNNTLLPFLILGGESIFWFALAAFVLDTAISLNWLKPFSSKF
jgi:hypothetical protein